jgi:hypothetical protein
MRGRLLTESSRIIRYRFLIKMLVIVSYSEANVDISPLMWQDSSYLCLEVV